VLLEAAIQTIAAILAFRFTIPIAVFMWFDRMIAAFGNYPFSIVPLAARAFLTYLLPVAFVAYLPAAVLTGRVASAGVPEWLAYASPAAGPLQYILARYAWYRALRHYESVGGLRRLISSAAAAAAQVGWAAAAAARTLPRPLTWRRSRSQDWRRSNRAA
jgi:viologen exporter family transport system permease protein